VTGRAGRLALALACLAGAVARGGEVRWIGTWAASPQRVEPHNMPPEPGLGDATLRQVVRVSIGGRRLRVRVSNAFGERPLAILGARVAASAGGAAIRHGSDRPVTFGGRGAVEIPAGAPWASDPVEFDLPAGSDLVVTLRVKDPTDAVTGHPGARGTSYLRAGDALAEPDLPGAARAEHWYYLCGIDVEADDPGASALAVLGDSITDGRGSPTDGNGRWTDHLARRLAANGPTARVAVLNQGLGGNRLLRDGLGPAALARLDRDVLAQPGVRWLVVFEGINDLGTRSASAADVIAAYEQILARCRDRGIRVYGATLLPCGGSSYAGPGLEAARGEINAWIRGSGRFDAVIDLDAAARDPADPSRLRAEVDGGDHLHPGPEGYRLLADAVDLGLFVPE
jgi:lysophospholipase L1-like esterase